MSGVHYMNMRAAKPGDTLAGLCGRKVYMDQSFHYSSYPEEITCSECLAMLGKNTMKGPILAVMETVAKKHGFESWAHMQSYRGENMPWEDVANVLNELILLLEESLKAIIEN